MPIKTAIIDDHEAIRLGLGAAFAASGDDRVALVASASTVPDFLAAGVAADVVLLDLRLADDSDPKDNAKELRARGFQVVVYSIADNTRLLRSALAGGAAGVCRKADPIAATVDAIVAVSGGQQVISQEILAAIEGDKDYVAADLVGQRGLQQHVRRHDRGDGAQPDRHLECREQFERGGDPGRPLADHVAGHGSHDVAEPRPGAGGGEEGRAEGPQPHQRCLLYTSDAADE